MADCWDEFEAYRSRAYSAGDDVRHYIPVAIKRKQKGVCPGPHADHNEMSSQRRRIKHELHFTPIEDEDGFTNKIENLIISDSDVQPAELTSNVRDETPDADRARWSDVVESSSDTPSDTPLQTASTQNPENQLDSTSHKRSVSYFHRPPSHHSLAWKQISDAPTRRRTYSMPSRNRHVRGRSRTGYSRSDHNQPVNSSFIRIRTFSTSSKGIISKRDSFKQKADIDDAPVTSPGESKGVDTLRSRTWSGTLHSNTRKARTLDHVPPHHKVVVIGSHGVGKSSLIHQFMTSEYLANQNVSFDDDRICNVSVVLDGEESIMEFIEHTPLQGVDIPNGDAYAIIFSISELSTFDDVVDTLVRLQSCTRNEASKKLCQLAVILVANKQDIVRHREVDESKGKEIAIQYNIKYAETSAIINHNVDDLLVGILKQIRLKEKQLGKRGALRFLASHDGCLQLGKLFRRGQTSTSCDNLLIL